MLLVTAFSVPIIVLAFFVRYYVIGCNDSVFLVCGGSIYSDNI